MREALFGLLAALLLLAYTMGMIDIQHDRIVIDLTKITIITEEGEHEENIQSSGFHTD
tara:strand:- start:87543 stop:87716 length:174 start_codon:yes stop_codon:yes gene_type:complete